MDGKDAPAGFQGAKAAVFVGDRLLVLLRDDKPDLPHPAHWDFPGGGREGDETPEETLAREVDEEVGLDLPAGALVWKRAFTATDGSGQTSWFFVVRLPAGSEARILFGDEGQGWALMTPDRFLALPDAIPSLQHRLRTWLAESGAG